MHAWSLRLSSVALALALCLGDIALCAGWQATPEARKACCENGVACPMRNGATPSASASHAVAQSDADRCCASSERGKGGPSAQFSATSLAVAIVPIILHAPKPAATLQAMGQHHSHSPPVHAVARHVLLSVFLL